MKRVIIGLIACIVLTGCQTVFCPNEISAITFAEFEAKLKKGDSFTLIIGRDDCPNCVALEEFIKTGSIEMYEPLFLKYTNEEKEIFLDQISQYFDDLNMIPYYAIIQDGNIIKTGQGYSDKDDFMEFVKSS